MSLGPQSDYYAQTDISRFWAPGAVTEANTKAGGVAVLATAGSGVGMDDVDCGSPGYGAVNTVEYVTSPSGAVPIGVLINDIQNEPTNEPRRWNTLGKVVYPGQKVTLIRHGWVVTDMIVGTPGAGDVAYLGASGKVTATQETAVSGWEAPVVGKFETSKDADGFARVFIDL